MEIAMFNIDSRASLKALMAVGFGLSLLVVSSTAFAAAGGGGGGGGGGGAGAGEGGAGEATFNTTVPGGITQNTLPHLTIPTFVEQTRREPCRVMKKNDRCQ
jgi:hypothetical protein